MRETFTEKYVRELLQSKGINAVEDLTIEKLSEAFNVRVFYEPYGTCMKSDLGITVIMLDSRINELEQHYQFLHELSHLICNHASIQFLEEYQWRYYELKANHVIEYLAMPLYMFCENCISVEKVSEKFFVPYELAYKRLVNIWNRQFV